MLRPWSQLLPLLTLLALSGCSSPELLPTTGPDESQCAEPIPGDAINTLFVCDCAEGADSGCEPGDDAADGRTEETPKRSLEAAKMSFEVAGPGHQVALCRGGAWLTEGVRMRPSPNCRADAPCIFADYGDGADPRPLIVATQPDRPTFDIALADNEPRAGYEFRNLHFTKSAELNQGVAIFLFRNLSDVAVRCVEIEKHNTGIQVQPDGAPTARITVEDCDLHDNGKFGFLGGANAITIARNRFVNNGFERASSLEHNLYLTANGAANKEITGAIVRGNYLQKSAVQAANGQCQGASLTAHGGVLRDVLIENNVIEEPPGEAAFGCWGISVAGGTASLDAAYDVIIRGNVVRDVGNVSIGLASCVDCIIESNLIIQTQVGGAGIKIPNRETMPPDADQTRTIVRNNTIWFSGGGGGVGISVGQRGEGHVITSNIVAYREASDGVCYDYDLPAEAYAHVEANLGYNCLQVERGTGGMDPSLLITDPQFVDPPLDFRLLGGSEAIDSARKADSPTTDILGEDRDDAPDRGAFEN